MRIFISKYKYQILLISLIVAYIVYFSYLTILRYRTLYASYFDLGIMHQTVFNTYRAITNFDPSRILELTDPFGQDQIKRMNIHNDLLLALLSPLYLLYPGPETLLIIQTVVLALGAFAIYKITEFVLRKVKYGSFLALIFAVSYLLYPPMQRANLFDFHAVTLSTSFLLFMFYFWLVKRKKLSFLFFLLSILSKEQVALTTSFFGIYLIYKQIEGKKISKALIVSNLFPVLIFCVSVGWFLISMLAITYFRNGSHFALSYYTEPIKYIVHIDTLRYIFFLFSPLGFLSLLSPTLFLIALPEFAINLLSNNENMRNIIYHYTSVIEPFVFIAAIFGTKKLIGYLENRYHWKKSIVWVGVMIFVCSLILAGFKGPLPFSREKEVHPFLYPQKEAKEVYFWQKTLKDESLKISSTGQLAPFFTSRRYFYNFSQFYKKADYVVIRLNEIYNYPEKEQLIPVYQKLQKDTNFKLIYKNDNLEVYKKI